MSKKKKTDMDSLSYLSLQPMDFGLAALPWIQLISMQNNANSRSSYSMNDNPSSTPRMDRKKSFSFMDKFTKRKDSNASLVSNESNESKKSSKSNKNTKVKNKWLKWARSSWKISSSDSIHEVSVHSQ